MKKKKHTAVRLYTRGGDFGTTGLIGGERQRKDAQIFEVLGTIDELNAWFGLVAACEKKHETSDKKQTRDVSATFQTDIWFIQDRLLRMGAVVAGSRRVRLTARDVGWLEKRIDFFQTELGDEWLTSFVLPV